MSEARLHHYVPQFLLTRFSVQPAADKPMLYHLDKATGRCSLRRVRGEAAITGYNDLKEMEGASRGDVEHALSLVEGEAAPIVDALVDRRSINAAQRVALTLFLYFQYHRTPRGRQWLVYIFEKAHTLNAMQRVLDPAEVQAAYRHRGEEVSLEDAERLGREWAAQLDSGELVLKAGNDHAVGVMFMFADEIVPRIAGETAWEVLHAPPGSDFIISDHPILIHNSSAPPGLGNGGWLASPETLTTCPIDAKAALRMFPGPPQLSHVDATPEQVDDTNLRTYASAEWAIYGRSAGMVQRVRAQAKRERWRVRLLTPTPPTIHIFEQREGEAAGTVQRLRPTGEVRRRQGWPRWDDEG